jgi:tetratricopeptide (TPR) repeat protein
MCLAVRSAVQQVQAGLPVEDWLVASGPESDLDGARMDFPERCAATVARRGTRSSRVIVLDLLQRLGHHDAVARGLVQLREQGLDSLGLRYIEIEALLQADAAPKALAMLEHSLDLDQLDEHQAHRLQQFARVCHRLGQPERALPALRWWTERFPDSPDAAGVWQQRALLSLSIDGSAAEVREALERCVELSGPRPELLAVLSLIPPNIEA